jgi:putative membrane protein
MLRLAIVVTAVVVLAGAATPSVSSANTAVGKGIAPTSAGAAAGLDTLPPEGATGLTPAGLQMMNDDGDFWNGWWIIMPIMMVLFWGGVIALVVWGIRQFTRGREQGRSPLDIAKERLAKGEISKDEFEGIKGGLEGS